ncbi:hypothetical protein AVEN_70182-1 [Araneus ventricosus]|uniref:Retrovirus-related Pol polyprotein from transposon TNT 1-94-like beta-barrel domain-containing protein n=1 Tax=Araneus ventricosus TaxID=182803 RepID=A0A4Y2FDH6_ARAVE|nr:hypothetical protein AVEN_70182-1 [Araneus ventricosus]
MSDKIFIEFETFQSPRGITTVNGKVLPALGKGTLQIVSVVNNKEQFKELKDAWYVPEINQFTKFMCDFLLQQKSDVVNAFQEFIDYATNLGHTAKEVISDNGREFDNKEVRMFLKKKGVIQRCVS